MDDREEVVETVAVVEVWADTVAMEAVAVDLAVAEDANAGHAGVHYAY